MLNVRNSDGVYLLPENLFVETYPPVHPLAGRVSKGASHFDVEPRVWHHWLRNFNGTSKELTDFYISTPQTNKNGEKLKTPYFYSAIILHGSKGPEFFPICKTAFEEALVSGEVNSVVCNSYMTSARARGDFNEVRHAFENAWGLGVCDIETFNIFIKAAGHERIAEVMKGYELAQEYGKTDLCTANTVIDLLGKAGKYEQAYRIFLQNENRADVFTYACVLRILGDWGNFGEAKRVFEDAKRKVKINPFVLGHFMQAANLTGNFEEAIRAYEQSRLRNSFLNTAYHHARRNLNVPREGEKRNVT